MHRAAPSFSDVYKSVSASGQREFLLSSSQDSRLGTQRSQVLKYALPKWRLAKQATTTFSPTTRWHHQKPHQLHLLLHSPDGSPTATQFSQFKV
ncbi:hypothetical protein AVEN_111800-1 [Araneus ventricosus]|uniref:Uncharacterized protein n=1 Tax=Araneus ventricosus TaxID=182803 RepID=A0A4Y2UWA7_ARAVE|nr:hypothetical protein AVEN_111800-1 [Araneus ventricosus]